MSTYSKSEVGHAKNVANFQKLIEYCKYLGADYEPTNPLAQIANMENVYTNAQNAINHVHEQKGPHTAAVNARQKVFENLPTLASEIGYAISAMSDDKRILEDAKTYIRKIRGYMSKVKTNDNQEGQETAEPRSTSQLSFDKRIDHFKGLIEVIKTIPEYAPNEDNLKITSLENYLNQLNDTNKQVMVIYQPYSKAMIQRDEILYNKENGLYMITQKVKSYIKQKFKLKSPQYEKINDIKFKNLIKRK